MTKQNMPDNQEQQYEDELNQSRAGNEENEGNDSQDNAPKKSPSASVSIPVGMLCIAGFFDLIGLIPILNLFTDLLAALLFWMWQKNYVPSFDPMLNIFTNKVIDICTLGIFPSNIGIVLVAYIKKRAASKETPAVAETPEPATNAA
ncbi:MAG: hypothetical protein UT31_C0016G0008 [Parcubacteria group bacterium GW2011_GWF2_39_13b]|nr:MAG: hypothetical protein UT31_C0016G0008 [Parcubacteria group bacterium GW2011_GWF2_39_13b]